MHWNFESNTNGGSAALCGDMFTKRGASCVGNVSLPISVSLPAIEDVTEEVEDDEVYIEGVSLGGVIIGLVLFLSFVAYLMGYSEIIGKMLWFGGFIYLIKDHL